MAELLICPPGAIDAETKKRLTAAGIVVVEAEDPEALRFIRPAPIVPSGDLLWAAFDAMSRYGSSALKHAVFDHLTTMIKAEYRRGVRS